MRNDPGIAGEQGPWLPTLIAVPVDAVGSTDGYLAHQMTESILGATWLAKQAGDDWFHLPPWIMGDRRRRRGRGSSSQPSSSRTRM